MADGLAVRGRHRDDAERDVRGRARGLVAVLHDRVERVMIDDHNVPSLKQMLEFADSVREWLAQHPDNVIVVHCKGRN